MDPITLFTTSEYEAQSFDAVLFRDETVVCVRGDSDEVRLVPLDKVNHVDGDAESMLVDTEIPDSFYGGGDLAFVDVEQFPEIQTHLEDIRSEDY